MRFEEYRQHDATGLAELVTEGSVAPGELLDCALARMEDVNPSVNAVTVVHEDVARKAIDEGLPKGPFHGVPILLKDLFAFFAGTVVTNGSRLTGEIMAPHDSTLITRLKETGVAIFGKAAAPEFGVNVSTEPLLHGPCRNPFDLSRSAGGSSGGSAAAVAAGIVPMAHATDGGGSIRIPAASCGLVGLKPSRARNPIGPDIGEAWNGLACGHVITKTVRDSARMLDALSGPEPGDPYGCPPPEDSFEAAMQRPHQSLRIALVLEPPLDTPIDTEVCDAIQHTAKLCEGLGHNIEPYQFDFIGPEVGWAMLTIVQSNLATDLALWEERLGRKAEDHCERVTLALAERGRQQSALDVQRAIRVAHGLARGFGRLFQSFDVILTPSLTHVPPKLGVMDQNDPDLDHHLELVRRHVLFMPLANISGCPAMTLPLHVCREGLPIGSMFMAPFAREDRLIHLAAALEQAKPWNPIVPKL